MPVHLRPSAPTAADAIVCGDPARALGIAQELLVEPRMSNHHRGLWGYHGHTAEGRALTVQATGIGGPSAAVVLHELAALGARRVIRIGTCRAGAFPQLALGGAVAVVGAIAADGTSRALGAGTDATLAPDPVLGAALGKAVGATALARSGDLYYPPGDDRAVAVNGGPALVEDLQTATLLAQAPGLGIRAAAALVVAVRDGVRLEDEPLERSLLALASTAAAVLAAEGTGTAARTVK